MVIWDRVRGTVSGKCRIVVMAGRGRWVLESPRPRQRSARQPPSTRTGHRGRSGRPPPGVGDGPEAAAPRDRVTTTGRTSATISYARAPLRPRSTSLGKGGVPSSRRGGSARGHGHALRASASQRRLWDVSRLDPRAPATKRRPSRPRRARRRVALSPSGRAARHHAVDGRSPASRSAAWRRFVTHPMAPARTTAARRGGDPPGRSRRTPAPVAVPPSLPRRRHRAGGPEGRRPPCFIPPCTPPPVIDRAPSSVMP